MIDLLLEMELREKGNALGLDVDLVLRPRCSNTLMEVMDEGIETD